MTRRIEATVLALGLFISLTALPKAASAQSVIGISEILSSTSSSEIDTYSATEIDYQTSLYYGAYVEGYLYQNGTLIAAGSASDPSDAYGYMSKPLQVPDEYQLESDHYLVATYVYEYYDGTTYWSNPDYYLIGTGDSTDPSGSSFAPGGGPAYYDTQYLYLGTTAVAMSSAGPTITSIDPAAGTVGTSGTITVYGDNLVDVFTGQASASITGSGVTLSVNSANASQVVLNYSIATNASTGNQNLTLATRFGTSNAAAFNIGDPTPVINSISPDIWQAGTAIQVAITGQHFGTNPSLTITGPGVTASIVSAGDTQIVANVTISISSPGGTASVDVQSNGYIGSGFLGTNPGQSSQTSNTANVQPVNPAPQILFNGSNVSGTSQNVMVGQQIALTVPQPPSGLIISKRSWSGVNSGDAIDSWTPGQQPKIPNSVDENFTFYWINSGTSGQASYTVTYTWTLDNGQSNSASVIFNVVGPAGVTVSTTPAQLTAAGVNIIPPPTSASGSAPILGLATLNQPGIEFMATATSLPANGTYTWVQVITTDEIRDISQLGPNLLPGSFADGHALDKSYPYGDPFGADPIGTVSTTKTTNDTAQDSPYTQLPPDWGEVKRDFVATMYLMWDPALPAGCKPGYTCTSIPVPLGSVTWQWTGDAINTLQPQTAFNPTTGKYIDYPLWIENCSSAINSSFQPANIYPTWQTTENGK